MISYDDFKKVEMKVGQIISAEKIPDSEKLLKLSVDFGFDAPRQVISGIAKYFPEGSGLAGKKAMFVTNLEPRMIMGFESQAMILAVGENETFSLLNPVDTTPAGAAAR